MVLAVSGVLAVICLQNLHHRLPDIRAHRMSLTAPPCIKIQVDRPLFQRKMISPGSVLDSKLPQVKAEPIAGATSASPHNFIEIIPHA
jgi:hypothetical protein